MEFWWDEIKIILIIKKIFMFVNDIIKIICFIICLVLDFFLFFCCLFIYYVVIKIVVYEYLYKIDNLWKRKIYFLWKL